MTSQNYEDEQSRPLFAAKASGSKANRDDELVSSARRKRKSVPADGKFYTLAEIGDRLAVSDRTVHRWVGGKNIVAHRFGGATRISAIELTRFITRARRGATPLQHNPLEESFCTTGDVAEILNVCERTVRRRIRDGELVAHHFGRIVRIGGSDLNAFIAGHRDL